MVMDSRSQFLLQLLEKLGAPLMRAVNARPSGADLSGQQDAQTIAALLSETVKISISLSQSMHLKQEDGDADAIRVALASIAGGLVADSYEQTGRIPAEADARRISGALESVLAFSGNFAPAAEHAPRLQTLNGTAPFIDPMQAELYAMNALVPVIAAVAEFPFGQQETKLIQDISAKLSERAKSLREKLANISGEADAKMAELVILQSLANLYASAHRAETARLNTLSDEARGGALSLDPVWSAFDRQLSMLQVLIGAVASGAVSGGAGGGVKPAVETPATQAPIQPAPIEQPPEQAAPPVDQPAQSHAQPQASTDKPANPMAFFKKKDS
jgi:hypothetical protein